MSWFRTFADISVSQFIEIACGEDVIMQEEGHFLRSGASAVWASSVREITEMLTLLQSHNASRMLQGFMAFKPKTDISCAEGTVMSISRRFAWLKLEERCLLKKKKLETQTQRESKVICRQP